MTAIFAAKAYFYRQRKEAAWRKAVKEALRRVAEEATRHNAKGTAALLEAEKVANGLFRRLAENRLQTLATTAIPNAVAGTGVATRFSIEFGDDTGDWARDGECDDVCFEGDGPAELMLVNDCGRDAADCRHLYDEGRIRLFGIDLASGAIDFGDDTSEWAQDGDCDDPRFEGDGKDSFPLHSDRGHDAADCRRLYDEGRIRLFGVNSIPGR